jgi:four helix bundle protein
MTMNKFVALENAGQLIELLSDLVPSIARRDGALGDQLRRAGSSVLLNIAEGNRRVGKDRQHFFRVAAGSAAEVQAVLKVAVSWRYIERTEIVEVGACLDRQLALLWGLTRRRA